jgi:hypothetical protein
MVPTRAVTPASDLPTVALYGATWGGVSPRRTPDRRRRACLPDPAEAHSRAIPQLFACQRSSAHRLQSRYFQRATIRSDLRPAEGRGISYHHTPPPVKSQRQRFPKISC